MNITILVPVFNEAEVLDSFHQRLTSVVEKLNVDVEILYVNDGSRDESLAKITAIANSDSRVSYINLSRNFGKEAAMSAGIDRADGDAVIIIDADLQDPPELIPALIERWLDGYDNVYAQRTERLGESFIKKFTAKHFYKLMERVGRFSIPSDTGDFRLLSRRAILAIRSLPESNRFMKGIFSWIGYRSSAVTYTRDPRAAGTTKFNYWKLWNFALDGITSFTTLPLKVASYVGLLTSLGALAYLLVVVLKTLIFGEAVAGYPSLMAVVLFMGGAQMLFLGIIGEYIGRMFDETKRRPLYLVEAYVKKTQGKVIASGESDE